MLDNVSKDLKEEFPEIKGFSVSNLKTCKLFYEYFQFSLQLGDDSITENGLISHQAIDQFEKAKNSKPIIGSQPVNQLDNAQNKRSSQDVNHIKDPLIITTF